MYQIKFNFEFLFHQIVKKWTYTIHYIHLLFGRFMLTLNSALKSKVFSSVCESTPQQISIFALFCNLELAKSAYVFNFTWNLIFASMGARYEREENCKCKIFISLAPPRKTMYLLYLRPVVRWRQKYGWFQLFEMQSIQICITCRWKRTFTFFAFCLPAKWLEKCYAQF